MPRKGENIYKRKDGRWEGRYIGCYDENHKAKYVYIYGKTYTEVKQKLAIERGRQKQHVPAEKKQITYGEVLDLWLHSTKTSIKESTYARYAHLINSHIKPQLGDYKLSMLSTEIIEDFIENQLVEGQLDRTGGLAPKTVIDLLAIVKSTIGYKGIRIAGAACDNQLFIRLDILEGLNQISNTLFWHQTTEEQYVGVFFQPELICNQTCFPNLRPIHAIRDKVRFSSISFIKIVLHSFAQNNDLVRIFHSIFFAATNELGCNASAPLLAIPVQTGRCQVLDNIFHK